jgi:hypothetical protein
LTASRHRFNVSDGWNPSTRAARIMHKLRDMYIGGKYICVDKTTQ